MQYLTFHCSSCSSEESAKAKTQKEVIKTLKELKLHLPPEKRHNNKSTTLNTLKYALRCVKQVEGKLVFLILYLVSASVFLENCPYSVCGIFTFTILPSLIQECTCYLDAMHSIASKWALKIPEML